MGGSGCVKAILGISVQNKGTATGSLAWLEFGMAVSRELVREASRVHLYAYTESRYIPCAEKEVMRD